MNGHRRCQSFAQRGSAAFAFSFFPAFLPSSFGSHFTPGKFRVALAGEGTRQELRPRVALRWPPPGMGGGVAALPESSVANGASESGFPLSPWWPFAPFPSRNSPHQRVGAPSVAFHQPRRSSQVPSARSGARTTRELVTTLPPFGPAKLQAAAQEAGPRWRRRPRHRAAASPPSSTSRPGPPPLRRGSRAGPRAA